MSKHHNNKNQNNSNSINEKPLDEEIVQDENSEELKDSVENESTENKDEKPDETPENKDLNNSTESTKKVNPVRWISKDIVAVDIVHGKSELLHEKMKVELIENSLEEATILSNGKYYRVPKNILL